MYDHYFNFNLQKMMETKRPHTIQILQRMHMVFMDILKILYAVRNLIVFCVCINRTNCRNKKTGNCMMITVRILNKFNR